MESMTCMADANEEGWTLPLHSLPRGFLRLLEDPPDPPVDPRPSATRALIREGREGLEVLPAITERAELTAHGGDVSA